ncbi:hypothetical protein YC2023_120610 [Brassica napus]
MENRQRLCHININPKSKKIEEEEERNLKILKELETQIMSPTEKGTQHPSTSINEPILGDDVPKASDKGDLLSAQRERETWNHLMTMMRRRPMKERAASLVVWMMPNEAAVE